ncbi:MAG: hypothetical protein Q4G42_01455 [Neisseria sp.]|nr:hypothetical protein [Neisseria sp.]
MKSLKIMLLCGILFTLNACASANGSGKTEVYGQITGGIEHTKVQ